jgi:hypothetical protein
MKNLILPEEAGGLTPTECAQKCRAAITNWTKAWLEGEKFCTPNNTPWKTHEDAILAWKEALDHWESLGRK